MDELDLSEIENRWNKAFPLIQMGCFSKGCSVGYGFIINDEFESEYAPASQEFIDNAPMDISALVLEVKRLRQDRAEVRRDALLEACQAQCYYCRNGYEVELKSGINYVHKAEGRVFTDCNASLIRYKLLAADQGQSPETKIIDAKTEIENIAKIQPSQPPTETDPIASFGRFLFYSPKKKGQGQGQDKE